MITSELRHQLQKLELVIFDFDGVMTDNKVLVAQDGTEYVRCDRSDGLGVELLRKRGMRMMVLSKQTNPVTKARCDKLQLDCYHGIDDKLSFLQGYLREAKIKAAQTAFVGNDVNDIECLKVVGLPVAVADAHEQVLPYARLTLRKQGGKGAVREFCDMLLSEKFAAFR